MKLINKSPISISIIIVLFLNGCATQSHEKFSPGKSYLYDDQSEVNPKVERVESENPTAANLSKSERFRFVAPIKLNTQKAVVAEDVLSQFSEKSLVRITADELPLRDYLHQVLGEQLDVSYVIADEVKDDTQSVTLNLQEKISPRKLFTLTEKLLTERSYIIRYDDNIFYIHKDGDDNAKGDVVYGYGNSISDIPQTSAEIIQMVPFEYGMQLSLGNTLRQLIGVKAIPDQARNSLTLQGKRKDIIKAMELINIMDTPSLHGRQIGMFKSVFIETTEIVKKLQELLGQEGISVGSGGTAKMALSIVTLDKQGTMILFANNQEIINRAVFWAEQIDKPIETIEKQYFIYQPQFSRAIDMGESLEALIDAGGGSIGSSTSAASENGSNRSRKRSISASSKSMKMVVDERANSLIFYTTGVEYQQLYPLIKRLDILPKQVMLEVMIAEVTLTDEFKQGVEFAFNNGNYGLSTKGAFMGEGFGGLSYLLKGADGEIAINLLQTNSLVNILSKPSLVVRDGVNATINVGTDIPIIGETTSDPDGDRQTTSIEYRKTGVELTVTPTVNAQGIVLMEIKQKISNEVDAGGTSVVSPSVFERTINTEVVAESGQTVVLGGLISENVTEKESKVPFFGDLPLIGKLFRANTESGDKTELVVLVTPRVIESSSDWDFIRGKFSQGLNELIIE